jgi:hypothetical protein
MQRSLDTHTYARLGSAFMIKKGFNKWPIKGRSVKRKKRQRSKKQKSQVALAANRTRGPSMATMDFTTKPLMLSTSFDVRRWLIAAYVNIT